MSKILVKVKKQNKKPSRWRAGREWNKQGTVVDTKEFTEEQLKQLEGDQVLEVSAYKEPKPEVDEKGGKKK